MAHATAAAVNAPTVHDFVAQGETWPWSAYCGTCGKRRGSRGHALYALADMAKRSEAAEILTLAEAAERLGLSAGTLGIQARRGKLHARKLGRDWVVTGAEIARYAAEHRGRRQPSVTGDDEGGPGNDEAGPGG